MIRVWSQFFGFLVIAAFAGSITTSAYFFDSEASPQNLLSAINLDGELSGEPFDDQLCSAGSSAMTVLTFANVGDLDFDYGAEVENVSGDAALCDVLVLIARRNGDIVYTGPLTSFTIDGFALGTGGSDEWKLSVSLPVDGAPDNIAGLQCTFDTVFLAHQENLLSGQGFYDRESLTHTFVGTGGGGGDGGDVNVEIDNDATIVNNASSTANTGGNTVGPGGTITTGDASSTVTVTNVVNQTTTVVTGCGCDSGDASIDTDTGTSTPPQPHVPHINTDISSRTGSHRNISTDDTSATSTEDTLE